MARRRPLVWLALAWILGIALGRALAPAPTLVFGAAIAIFGLAIGLFRLRHQKAGPAILALVAVLGALAHQDARLPAQSLYERLGELEHLRGHVRDFPTQTERRTSFVLNSDRLPGGIQINYWHPEAAAVDIAYGDRLAIGADIEVPARFADFDYRRYLATRSVWGVADVWSSGQIEHREPDAGSPLLHWGYRTRQSLFGAIDAHLPASQADLLKGLLVGVRAQLSDRIEGSFRDAGVMHVLAVSGLHLAILLGLGWSLLRWLGRSITETYLLLIPLAVVYLTVVGFKLSLVRAALMLAFVALGWVVAERGRILKRWVDPLQGLSLAALVILVGHPPTLFNVSFQLSFSATAGILIMLQTALPRLNAWRVLLQRRWATQTSRLRHWAFAGAERIVMLGLITGAAQVAVAPVIAWHFHRLYIGAFAANLAIVPIVTVALWVAVIFLALAAFGASGPAGIAAAALAGVLALLIHTAQLFAGLPWAYAVLDRVTLLAMLALGPLLLDPSVWALLRGGRFPITLNWTQLRRSARTDRS